MKISRRSFSCGLFGVGALAYAAPPVEIGSIRVAHLCDPQFGFVSGRQSMKWRAAEHFEKNYAEDFARCARAIERINAMKPDLLLFGGDMVQNVPDVEKDWIRLLERVRVPWMITPGNHDMGNRITKENLDRFRCIFGRDRDARDINGWRIITGNSQFWHPTELNEEQVAYEHWVRDELEKAKKYGGRVILATHIPPFAFDVDEKDSYDNCPADLRTKRLEKYESAGVRFLLTAHQHRLAVRGYKSLTILGTEALCGNFDMRPCGFRILNVNCDFSYSWNFIEV
jgi:3',5'-cyclic AMP phosphodiesterase CpdA